MAGLNISTRWRANLALFILRISSSVFPENIEPQITSILPLLLVSCMWSSEIDVVGIDEAQFFDDGLIDVCRQLANNGIRVIIAGLDMDFKGNPFGPMPQLCAIADEVSKVHAICVKCGDLASFSHRTVKNDKQVLLGETAEYEPLCRECYLRARGEDGQKI